MFHVSFARLLAAALICHSSFAVAETIEVDLHAAVTRARRAAPTVAGARGRILEAEARVVGADVAFVANPELEAGVGPRFTSARPIDVELRIAQELEPWQRAPRRAVARAEVAEVTAEGEVQMRELDLEVSLAFYDALAADRQLVLAQRAAELAQRGADVANRRRHAGEITDLDANLAKVALGRARSAVETADAERVTNIGSLAALVGAAPSDRVALVGELEPLPLPVAADPTTRADLRALDRERETAVAEGDQAIAHGRPNLGVWLGYQREDATDIVLAGVRVTLPIWNRARGERASAAAKEHRARETHGATLRAATRQIADAVATSDAAARAVATFERDVVPALDDSEALLAKTLDAGQIAISDYLFAQQQLLDGRREQLERRLALAKASAAARYAMGVAP